jgi:hypothetical protein
MMIELRILYAQHNPSLEHGFPSVSGTPLPAGTNHSGRALYRPGFAATETPNLIALDAGL